MEIFEEDSLSGSKFREHGSIWYRTHILGGRSHHILLYLSYPILYCTKYTQASALVLIQWLHPQPINWYYTTPGKEPVRRHNIIEWNENLVKKGLRDENTSRFSAQQPPKGQHYGLVSHKNLCYASATQPCCVFFFSSSFPLFSEPGIDGFYY